MVEKVVWLSELRCRLFGHKRPLEFTRQGEAVRCKRCKAEWTVVLLGLMAERRRLAKAADFYTSQCRGRNRWRGTLE